MAVFKPAPPERDDNSGKALAPGEISQRVAILRRFKELLKAQRDRFRAYLDTLDKQKDVIRDGSADDLIRHVELEEKIVADIFSIQKVIDPLEKMYREVKTGAHTPEEKSGGAELVSLREALEGLRAEALIRSERNRTLLSQRMAEIRSEIKSLRSGSAYARRRSSFDDGSTATRIDIKG